MDNHAQVHKLVAIQKALLQIKTLSASSAIDDIATKALIHVVEIGDSLHPELIKEFKRKHADVMA